MINLEEFVYNPTPLTQDLLQLLIVKKAALETTLNKAGFLNSLLTSIKLSGWLHTKYREYYKVVSAPDSGQATDLAVTLKIIEDLFEKILVNNLLLDFALKYEKKAFQPIYTKNNLFLDTIYKLKNKEIKTAYFLNLFGHFGPNEFELSSPKYCEMNDSELFEIVKFAQKPAGINKIGLAAYLKTPVKKLFPVYAALKEELKYLTLRYTTRLRFLLLDLQRKNNIKNIFNLTFKEINKLA